MNNEHNKMRHISEAILTLIDTSKNAISTLDIDRIVFQANSILPTITKMDASAVRLIDKQNPRLLTLVASTGIPKETAENIKYLRIGVGFEGLCAKNRKHTIIKEIKPATTAKYSNELISAKLRSALCVPIVFDDDTYGTITVLSKDKNGYEEKDTFLLFSFATIVAIALKNAYLYKNLKDNYLNTINSLVMIMESKDHYMRGHSERVTDIAIDIAREMGLPESDLHILRTAGKLHDIGKITVSDFILSKKTELTPTEWAEIHLHTIRGVEMILPLKFLEPGISLIRNHHERYDGKGYPDGLKGDGIPLLARVLSIADSFDAMTSMRPYREPLSFVRAVDEIRYNSGTQFDPGIVKTFIQLMKHPS